MFNALRIAAIIVTGGCAGANLCLFAYAALVVGSRQAALTCAAMFLVALSCLLNVVAMNGGKK